MYSSFEDGSVVIYIYRVIRQVCDNILLNFS